jgi:hypothetical protein
MKKILLSLAVISGLSLNVLADDASVQEQIDQLNKKIQKLEKKQKKNTKKISDVNKLAAYDNIKFDIDFRTAYDYINYKTAAGNTHKNDGLYSNRLWLGMGYAPTSDMMFKGQLAFNKAFGQSTAPMGDGYNYYDRFDWIVNENLTDDTLRVREAYWFWSPHFWGQDWTLSVGRRPATNGFLISLREDDKAKSPIGHIINMEFDGISGSIKTGDLIKGSYLKLCIGRGLTDATARFDNSGLSYVEDGSNNFDNMDLIGVIAKLYDDGQYTAFAKYYRTFNAIGIDMHTTPGTQLLTSVGDMDGAALSFMISGIGDEINDFLDETILFASFAYSNTLPKDGKTMLGSADNEAGTSVYVGTQMPNGTGGKFGLEYNYGSEYWRPFTYGEDTMAGSKMAVRGNAYEAYWTQPIIEKHGKNIFSMQVRYTYMDYDYSGSDAFFGDMGTPMSMDEAKASPFADSVVETAQDLRIYFRYRY